MLARVLERFPQFELEAISWSVGKPADRAAPKPAPRKQSRAAKARPRPVFDISGRVNATQRNDYRGITAQVQRFAEALASRRLRARAHPAALRHHLRRHAHRRHRRGRVSGEAPRFTIVAARRLP